MQEFITKSAEETQNLAVSLAQKYKQGVIITLLGPLGAGKTTFVQGFAKGLGIKSKLISPTFILVKEYQLPYQSDAKLYHIDLYRLENQQQIMDLGLTDLFNNPQNIILIEWAEKLTNLPKKPVTKINLEYVSETDRKITVMD